MALGAIAGPVCAQASHGFQLSGSSRLGYEAVDGQARAGFDGKDGLINLRTLAPALRLELDAVLHGKDAPIGRWTKYGP
ncbi:hypothetical protein [Sphingosinicella sp. BN140058]|uniref:hypothetical protein n=1 Tax=Sphingosinicella sp. BN140058 TaxID=1892855 RepID=UPI001012E4FA|nr:hypothetical protein [Sphingosinicella sp. BN140058]QAY79077.1 hypothetical protein ETR14_22975 [Sphingosinicella sp. BN140058]